VSASELVLVNGEKREKWEKWLLWGKRKIENRTESSERKSPNI